MFLKSKSRKADKPVQTAQAMFQPAIVLARTRLPENVGMAARAMLNCGLVDLRLAAPGFNFPDQKAFDASSGADQVLRQARVFPTLEEAIADAQLVYACSGRPHDLNLPVMHPQQAAQDIVAAQAAGQKVAILFGAERAGLENYEVAKANKILTIPLQKSFNSLNVSQAVLLIGYQLFVAVAEQGGAAVEKTRIDREIAPAPREDVNNFLGRLMGLLDEAHFFFPPEKRQHMQDNVETMFARAGFTAQEIKTLHGIVTALVKLDKKD